MDYTQNYGGVIHVYSEPQIGTTFNVYIPTVKEQATDEKNLIPDLPGGNEHILIVDDELALLDVGRQLLEILGYRVSTANGGESALDQVRQSPRSIDLVLTDMTMPNMTGDKLAVELLKIRPDLPIILCTGYSAKISGNKTLKLGVKSIISKPIVKADLARIIREVLDRK